jgi:hypothetical protein
MPRGLNRTEEEGAWSAGVQEEVTGSERDTWQETRGRRAEECHVDGEREVGQMTGEEGGGRWRTGGNGEDDTKGDTTGKGPHNNNTPFRTPPSFIKDRMAKGGRNEA